MNQFGFEIKKTKKDPKLNTFTIEDDGSAEIIYDNGMGTGGASAYYYDLVAVPKDEVELIKTYRTISQNAEIDMALSEIKNEILVFDVIDKKAIEIDFDADTDISDSLKKKITEEYDNIYSILDFKNKGLDIFTDWYVDGRLYLHKVIEDAKQKAGIQKIIQIDPIKIKKIKQFPQADVNGTYDVSKIREFYVFSPDTEAGQRFTGKGLEINPDSITYVDSGLKDKNTNTIIGHLHKTIIPFNNMKLMEDSLVIYRVARAPERRVIYVDVGNLPKNKAESYMKELMNKFRNKLVYDSKTGNIVDRKNVLSMMEDYWLPRRDSGKGTQIDTLPGGDATGVITDVEYFKSKLFAALNVPVSRFSEQPTPFVFGKGIEIERDEYRFKKFVNRLRNRFVFIFEDLLKTQLILKNIIVDSDWDDIKRDIQYVFTEDNAFVEYKESEILNNRLASLAQVDPFVGRYFSKEWVMKNVMKMTDEEIKETNEKITSESPPSDNAEQQTDSTNSPEEPN